MLGFLGAGVSVAYRLVTVLVHVLLPVAGPLAVPAAIVAFTIAIRLLLLPLSYAALRSQAAQARLQPQLLELRRRHASQPERLQREVAALYQREGGSLLAGCLPVLAQLPFFTIMYRLFRSSSVGSHPNLLLAPRLLGAPLGAHWLGAAGPFSGPGLVFAGLFALLGLAGWMSARLASRAAAAAPLPVPAGRPAAALGGPAAAQGKIMTVLARAMPYSTVLIALFIPLAAGLYLLTTTCWTVAERAVLGRRLGRTANGLKMIKARPL
jgi:YidC/Oxa1 family membrane protein insertase